MAPHPVPPNVVDEELYRRLVREAKKKYRVWPSAYASGWVTREYKKAGGRYKKTSGRAQNTPRSNALQRWYKEKWVNVCATDAHDKPKPCGRQSAADNKKYPYCRPSVRVTSKTPATVDELGPAKIRAMCRKKRKEGLPDGNKPRRVTRSPAKTAAAKKTAATKKTTTAAKKKTTTAAKKKTTTAAKKTAARKKPTTK